MQTLGLPVAIVVPSTGRPAAGKYTEALLQPVVSVCKAHKAYWFTLLAGPPSSSTSQASWLHVPTVNSRIRSRSSPFSITARAAGSFGDADASVVLNNNGPGTLLWRQQLSGEFSANKQLTRYAEAACPLYPLYLCFYTCSVFTLVTSQW